MFGWFRKNSTKEAFQVYECTREEEREFEQKMVKRSTSAHLLLRIENILLKEHGYRISRTAALVFSPVQADRN